MIRRVAFKKAILAGAAGAVAWEITARALSVGGIPIFDIVKSLGMIMLGSGSSGWEWWPAGMLMHCIVGIIWAIFYVYFFWSTFDYRPAVQGLLFSLLPALLAGLVMVPQLRLMQPDIFAQTKPFAVELGLGGPVMIIFGHMIYGLVLGSLYVRPVGYPVGKRIKIHG